MMLPLVRKDHGANIANRVAPRRAIPPHREGGQAYFVPRPLLASEEGQLENCWTGFARILQHRIT
jgi:AraC family transcriptional activator FtrA